MHGRQWSSATTVEHATPVTMPSTDAGARWRRQPVEAHWRGNVVLYRSNSDERNGEAELNPLQDAQSVVWKDSFPK